MKISPQGDLRLERTKKMRTTSVGYRQHPRRTTAMVALVVVSLASTTTGTGLILAGPASAQSLTIASTPVISHRTSPLEPSGPVRHESPGRLVQEVARPAGAGLARPLARSAPDVRSTGPGP